MTDYALKDAQREGFDMAVRKLEVLWHQSGKGEALGLLINDLDNERRRLFGVGRPKRKPLDPKDVPSIWQEIKRKDA